MPVILRMINTDFWTITKTELKSIVVAINGSRQKACTKHDKKLILRKIVQCTKTGSYAKGTPLPLRLSLKLTPFCFPDDNLGV